MKLPLVVPLLAVLVLGCDRSDQTEGEYHNVHSLQAGDCFTRKYRDAESWQVVLVVPCEADWSHRVVNRVWIEKTGDYPSGDFLWVQAVERCEPGWTMFLAPSPEGWSVGDRSLMCIAERGVAAPDVDDGAT
jgi:hypothetical protein